jgi:hypothetical protein
LLDISEQNKLRVLNVDLSKERDITIEFPYMQFRPYCTVFPFHTTDAGLPEEATNGVLRIYVMNALVSSSQSAPPVDIIVSIAAGDDFEAWSPVDRYEVYQLVLEASEVPQIGTEIADSAPEGEQVTSIYPTMSMPQHVSIFHSDPVLSVRYLLKRFYLTTSVEDQSGWLNWLPCICPNNTVGVAPVTIHKGPFQYWAAGYVGWRGSLNKKILGIPRGSLSRRRATGSQVTTLSPGTQSSMSSDLASPNGTEISTRNIISVNFPWYNNLRFHVSSLVQNFVTPEAERYQVVANINNQSMPMLEFTSAGEDFSYLYYVGAPRLRLVA